jgi:hypothetical protein
MKSNNLKGNSEGRSKCQFVPDKAHDAQKLTTSYFLPQISLYLYILMNICTVEKLSTTISNKQLRTNVDEPTSSAEYLI